MLSIVLSKRKSCPDPEGALQFSVGLNQIITPRQKTRAVVIVLLKGRHPTQLVPPKSPGAAGLPYEEAGRRHS